MQPLVVLGRKGQGEKVMDLRWSSNNNFLSALLELISALFISSEI